MAQYDIILVSGEPYVDHPFSGIGIIKKVLEDKGYVVGVIETPDWKKDDDFLKLGKPKLFFGISAGSMDSMLVNYTPMKKSRQKNKFSKMSYTIPDRAVTVYSNMIRKLFKDSKLVIAGTESSLRRFAHYDYWDNKLRKSILLDTRADILIYGYGELQIIEIAKRIKENKTRESIDGTCIVSKEVPKDFEVLPSYDEVASSKEKFCEMQQLFDTDKNLAQKFDNRYVLQYKSPRYTTKDLDYIYSLDYSRKIPVKYAEFDIIEFSVLTHRGCFGNCNFCSISAIGGKRIVSRSKESIVEEVKKLTKMPDFKGTIELSGASANMYGMDCENSYTCKNNLCLKCPQLDKSHKRMIELLREIRKMPEIKKIAIKSGVRYDLALSSEEYVREIVKHHVDETLMIAPEHISPDVLELMNKKDQHLKDFVDTFNRIKHEEGKDVELSYYLMVGHPGCTLANSEELREFSRKHKHADFVQVFTPTPMTVSTCMYYTGLNPSTRKPIYVPYTYNEKKKQKNTVVGDKGYNEED
jgi:uncharacterized radical SAM protein YgiQ